MLDESSEFRAIVKRATRSYLPYAELSNLAVPPGAAVDETWNALRTVLRLGAIEETVPDLDGTTYWYYRTHELSDAISTILCHCRAGSALDRQLAASQNRRLITRLRMDEAVAAAHLDGLNISNQTAYQLLENGRGARTPTQRVLWNSYEALSKVQRLADEPFTPELFDALLAQLVEKVEPRSWDKIAPRRGLLQAEISDDATRRHGREKLTEICDYANGDAGEDSDSPVLRALLIADMFRYYRPLPYLNGQVGRLAFKLYAIKAGLPVLGTLSLSLSKLQWEDGLLGPPLVALRPEQYAHNYQIARPDLTQYFTTGVQIMIASLISLRDNLAEIERRDAQIRNLLHDDSSVNHRQRSILGHALRQPDTGFTIAHHQRKHQVAYATARADFLGLVDRGWLTSTTKGKALVFQAAPQLPSLLARSA